MAKSGRSGEKGTRVSRTTPRVARRARAVTIELVDLNTVLNAGSQLIVLAAQFLVLYLKLGDAM